MDTKKNMSREQLLAYMRDNCTEAEAQQVRMWLRERLKDPGLDQLFSDLLDATETEYDPEGKERVRRKLDSILAACPAPNSPPRSGNLRRWRWSLRIIEYAAAVAAVIDPLPAVIPAATRARAVAPIRERVGHAQSGQDAAPRTARRILGLAVVHHAAALRLPKLRAMRRECS
jgi:hypothetical protein